MKKYIVLIPILSIGLIFWGCLFCTHLEYVIHLCSPNPGLNSYMTFGNALFHSIMFFVISVGHIALIVIFAKKIHKLRKLKKAD